MSLLALGVDVSTTQTAMVVLDHAGFMALRRVVHDTKEQGPRRLMQIRAAVGGVLDCAGWDLSVAAVEVPRVVIYKPKGPPAVTSFALESCAAVVMEVVQQRYPHIPVADPTPTEWQRDTCGAGGKRADTKLRSLAHAEGLGLSTDDDNLADAACIAEYGRELYIRDVLRRAA